MQYVIMSKSFETEIRWFHSYELVMLMMVVVVVMMMAVVVVMMMETVVVMLLHSYDSDDDDSNVSVESRRLFVNCDEKPHAVGL